MSLATQQTYPSLAEIVRQETDGGRLIVQFYLGVADGTLDGFRDHHRMAAANRIGKIAPKLVAEYLQKYYNNQCRDSLRGTLLPLVRRSPITKNPPEGSEQATRGPSVFQRRLTQLVREETGDGRTIFNFLNGVMHGTYTGFKPHHRLEAAKELASYLTPPQEPAPAPPTVIPAQAGTHPRSPEPTPTVIPVKTGTHPQAGSAEAPRFPTNNSKPKTKNSPPHLRRRARTGQLRPHPHRPLQLRPRRGHRRNLRLRPPRTDNRRRGRSHPSHLTRPHRRLRPRLPHERKSVPHR